LSQAVKKAASVNVCKIALCALRDEGNGNVWQIHSAYQSVYLTVCLVLQLLEEMVQTRRAKAKGKNLQTKTMKV
jgi:hypothetical protein